MTYAPWAASLGHPRPGSRELEESIKVSPEWMHKFSASEQVRWIIEGRMKAKRDAATRMAAARRQGF